MSNDKLVWRNAGSPNGLRRFMTQKQYDAQTPGVQKWYEPIRYEVPEGWQLVPVVPTESMCEAGASVPCANRQSEADWVADVYRAMLAAAPKLGEALDGAPTTRPAVASLTRYTLGGMCDSFGQDCGAEMEEDVDGEYVLLDDVITMLAAAPKSGDVDA